MEVIMHVTEQLGNVIRNSEKTKDHEKFLRAIYEQYKYVEDQIKKFDVNSPFGIEVIRETLNDFIKDNMKHEKIDIACKTCRTAQCCYTNVEIIPGEVISWLFFLKELQQPLSHFTGKEGLERFHLQLQYIKEHSNDKKYDIYTKMPINIRKCIFLNDDNLCNLYSLRPLKCRTWHAYDSNKLCNVNIPDAPIRSWASIDGEILMSVLGKFEWENIIVAIDKYFPKELLR